MFPIVSRTGKFTRLSPIFQKNNSLEWIVNRVTSSPQTIRGYSPLCCTNNHSINNISGRINRYYHRSIVNEQSFQVTPTNTVESELDGIQFEKISDDTLDTLTEYFEEIIDNAEHLPDADVNYGDGVLTIKFGDKVGTYVINRQTPNKQIWLSSPKSGPKRYDFTNGTWIYKHDGKSLHHLLDNEISLVVNKQTAFQTGKCAYSRENQK